LAELPLAAYTPPEPLAAVLQAALRGARHGMEAVFRMLGR